MELDQKIFKKIYDFFFAGKEELNAEEKERAVYLENIKNELTILARAFSGIPLQIFRASEKGGLRGKNIFLPEKMYFFSDKKTNKKYFLFKTLYFVYAHRLFHSGELPEGKIDFNSDVDTKILSELFQELPSLKDIYEDFKIELNDYFISKQQEPDYAWLTGSIFPENEANGDPLNPDTGFDEKALPQARTVKQAQPNEEVKSAHIEKKKLEDWVFTHNFEKVETVEDYSGLPRDFDGEDSLEEDYEALSEARIKHTYRIDEETHSVYQAEFITGTSVAESKETDIKEKYFTYDEYNYLTKSYLPDYCKVVHKTIRDQDRDYYTKTIEQNGLVLRTIKKQFARFHNKMMEIKRVEEGDHLNIDALTDMISDIKAGHTPNEKVYDSKRNREKELSILFLLDQSLSADGYAAGNRIIDVEKQIAILMGEVLAEYGIDFQIDGFSSKTRNHCRYHTLKSFDDDWNTAKYFIPSLQPSGYTRIGPAIRHAHYLISQRESKNKWVILLTDGKPNDYDRYEGKYGIADVKQALRELKADYIHTHAFAIEKQAKFYLPMMFGSGNYHILANAKELIFALTGLIEKIMTK